jgi:hypothetical protein
MRVGGGVLGDVVDSAGFEIEDDEPDEGVLGRVEPFEDVVNGIIRNKGAGSEGKSLGGDGTRLMNKG